MELEESVEEVSTIIEDAGKPEYEEAGNRDLSAAEAGKRKYVDLSLAKANAIEDEKDTSKDAVDKASRKRKSVDEEDLLGDGVKVMSIEEAGCPSSTKKLMEKPGIVVLI